MTALHSSAAAMSRIPPASFPSSATGPVSAQEQLIVEHMPLVRAIALAVRTKLPVHVELDDLISAGMIGLVGAASKFDAEKGIPFGIYAKHRVKGAILDSLREIDTASREMRVQQRQIEAAMRDLSNKLQRTPLEQEIADAIGTDIKRLRMILSTLWGAGVVSIHTPFGDQEDTTRAQNVPCAQNVYPDHIYKDQQRNGALQRIMEALPERHRQVIDLYFFQELKMKEIAGILGVNESRISQICNSALKKMAQSLEAAGIRSCHAF
jgi:RNA polymerase sigma factor for flagellar operon FliA